MLESNGINHAHICARCGVRYGKHKGGTCDHGPEGRCPRQPQEPKWPHSVKDEDKAAALFDRRSAAHWGAKSTTFKAMT